ncbi:MAG: hypothetical protein JNN15_14845 [Blastocatellia bacterium]|nr:hypothetical protein [Blastocatellia bacterium]
MFDDKFQPFKAGDWLTRQSQPTTKSSEKQEEIKFEKTYPLFQKYLNQQNFNEIFQKCEKSCIELDRLVRTAGKEQSQQAQSAINAYGRAMQLAVELLELKRKLRSR